MLVCLTRPPLNLAFVKGDLAFLHLDDYQMTIRRHLHSWGWCLPSSSIHCQALLTSIPWSRWVSFQLPYFACKKGCRECHWHTCHAISLPSVTTSMQAWDRHLGCQGLYHYATDHATQISEFTECWPWPGERGWTDNTKCVERPSHDEWNADCSACTPRNSWGKNSAYNTEALLQQWSWQCTVARGSIEL